jgi:hypothetical protein
MRRLFSVATLLFVAHSTTFPLAADEVQIDKGTLCPAAIHAFDTKDPAAIQEFNQFVQNVFDDLDAQRTNGGERAVSKRLTDKNVAGSVVLGHCLQHPTATIYDEAVQAYRGMRALALPVPSEPASVPKQSVGKPRFRSQ